MLVEIRDALMRGELPSPEAALWLGSALSAWLQSGDKSLEKHLRIAAPRGSHHRPQVLARRLITDERRANDTAVESPVVATDKESEP